MKKMKQNVKGLLKGRIKTALSAFLSVSMCLTLLGGAVEVFASQTDSDVTNEEEYETVAEVIDEEERENTAEDTDEKGYENAGEVAYEKGYENAGILLNETDMADDSGSDILNDVGIRVLDIDPDGVLDSVTVLPENTTVPPSDGKILFKNAVAEFSDELIAEGAWIYSSGNTIYPYIPVEESGAAYENPLKITAKDVAVIGGRTIDVELQFTKLRYGALSSASLTNIRNNDCAYLSFLHTDENGRLRFSGLDYYWADSGKSRYSYSSAVGMRVYPSGGTEVSYELKIIWSDTGEIVDLPFYQVAYDMDMGNGSDITTSEGYTFTDGIDRYYVYEGTKLQCIEESDGLYFGATGNTDVNGEASYKQAGVIAHSTNGTFSATCHVISACYNYFEIYSDYLNIQDPVKTVTSEGTNYDSSYAEGDTVTYEITQQMGEMYVDCFGEYNSLVITDTIPEGLALESYEMYSGTDKLGGRDGTGIYDSGKLTWTFSDSWIGNLSNYEGQDLKMEVTCSVEDDFLGTNPYRTITNTAYSYFSGLEYGPATADIKVENEPELSVSKKIINANYNSVAGALYKGDTFTYEITVSEAKENAAAENVVVTDTLTGDGAGPFEILSVTADNASVKRSGMDITATCGDLSYGESSTVYVEVEIVWTYDDWIDYSLGEQKIYNFAYASADNAKECVGSCDFQISQIGSLTVEKSMNPQNATKNTEWTFTLFNGENTFTKTLTGSGSVTFEEVPAGTYTLAESCDEELWGSITQSVQIGSGKTTTVQLTNTAATGDVKVVNTVTDPSGMYPYGLDGFSFTLEGTSDIGVDVSMSAETDASGNLIFENVYAGTYTLKKTGTPDNAKTSLISRIVSWFGAVEGIPDWWDTDDTWTVTVGKGKTTVVETENIYETGNVAVQKSIVKQEESGRELNGFAFRLEGVSDAGNEVELYSVTDESGSAEFYNIPVGTGYELTEVPADDVEAAADEANVSAQEILGFAVQDPDEYLETYPYTVDVGYLDTTEVEFENEVHPELHVTKTADGTDYYVGDVITYTIEVAQTMPGATSRDIEVVDDLPEGITLVDTPVLTGVEGTVDQDFTVYIPELAYGETAVITALAAAGSDLAGTVAVNRVKVTDWILDEDEDSVSAEILEPEPVATQDDDTDLYQPDETDEEKVLETSEPQRADPAGTGDSHVPVALTFTIFAAAFVMALTAVRRRKV